MSHFPTQNPSSALLKDEVFHSSAHGKVFDGLSPAMYPVSSPECPVVPPRVTHTQTPVSHMFCSFFLNHFSSTCLSGQLLYFLSQLKHYSSG